MAWMVGLLFQATAAIAPPPATAAAPPSPTTIEFDLRTATPCPARSDEITVCGERRDDEKYRLRTLADGRFEAKPLRAETGIVGDLKGGISTEHVEFGNGSVSNRVMAKLKLPF